MGLRRLFLEKLEYVLAFTAFLLVVFTLLNTNRESNLSGLQDKSIENMVISNFHLSRAIATGILMENEIKAGLALNESLIDIMTSESYLTSNSNRMQQTLDAKKSFGDYLLTKAKFDEYKHKNRWLSPIYVILSIINGFFAILLITKSSAKK